MPPKGTLIWPCGHCQPWHLQVLRDPQTDEVFAREWHAVGGPAFLTLLTAAEMLLGPDEPHR